MPRPRGSGSQTVGGVRGEPAACVDRDLLGPVGPGDAHDRHVGLGRVDACHDPDAAVGQLELLGEERALVAR